MTEEQVRALVRDALARHLGVPTHAGGPAPAAGDASTRGVAGRFGSADQGPWKAHLSHGRFVFLAPAEPDAPCIVEPHVRCHHCGFCQSYGH